MPMPLPPELLAQLAAQAKAGAMEGMAQNPMLNQTPTIGEGGFQMPSRDQFNQLAGQLGQIGQLEQVPMLQMQRGGGTYMAQPPQMQSFAPPMPTQTAEAGSQDQKGLLAMLDELMKKKGAAAQ